MSTEHQIIISRFEWTRVIAPSHPEHMQLRRLDWKMVHVIRLPLLSGEQIPPKSVWYLVPCVSNFLDMQPTNQ